MQVGLIVQEDSGLVEFSLHETLLYVTASVTRLDDSLKILALNFIMKVAQIIGDFWRYFKTHFLLRKICCGYRKLLATLYSNIWSHCCWVEDV